MTTPLKITPLMWGKDAEARLKAAERMAEALEECEEFFAQRADADHNGERYVGNAEMRMFDVVRLALAAYRESAQ